MEGFEMRFFGYAQNDRWGVAELLPDSSSQAPLNDNEDGFERTPHPSGFATHLPLKGKARGSDSKRRQGKRKDLK